MAWPPHRVRVLWIDIVAEGRVQVRVGARVRIRVALIIPRRYE